MKNAVLGQYYQHHPMIRDDGWQLGHDIVGLLFVLLLIGLAVWIGKRIASGSHTITREQANEDPIAVAKLRYARGEITREQFEQLHADLSNIPAVVSTPQASQPEPTEPPTAEKPAH